MIPYKDYETYLLSEVDKALYIWGAQGENIIALLPQICQMAGSLDKVDKILTLLQERLLKGLTMSEISAYDCSGLVMKYLMEKGIFKHDMTANDIYEAIPNKIPLNQVRAGDFVFYGSYKTNEKTGETYWSADHIGSAISSTEVVEARGSAYGVVRTKIADRPWQRAVRPDWWSDIPEPDKYILTRELMYTKPMMQGDDIKHVQDRLNELKYACGTADGIFGRKTDMAVKTFQYDKDLKQDGIVGKNTAEALGFIWEG